MAELALGLTKTVVEGALSRIQSAIDEEAQLQEGVAHDLSFITGEFQMMQAVLKATSKERAKKNEVMRAWLRQLRDLAFDVEDWVEFVSNLDRDDSRSKLAFWFWRRVVPSWAVPAPPRDLDDAAAEMKLLKARVEDVSQRNTRYNLFIGDDDSDIGSGSNKATTTPATAAANDPSVAAAFRLLRKVWRDETDRLRDDDAGSLRELINREEGGGNDLRVISLWGGDNLEVSSIIEEAYHDPEIWQKFQRRAWVKMARPLNLQEFLNTLLAQLLPAGHQTTNNNGLTTAELLQQVLVMEQRYLIVLEQVSHMAQWKIVRNYLPDSKNGSRIIVSTQHLGISVFCAGKPYQVSEVQRFSNGRPSICAFYQKVNIREIDISDILEWQIKRGSVISVYGDGTTKSRVVKRLYRSIQQNPGYLYGVRFGNLRWIPVVHPFNLADFSRRLLLASDYGFYVGGLQELKDTLLSRRVRNVLDMAMEDVIRRSSELLLGGNLVIIDGLQSTYEWDEIKSAFLSEPEPTKCTVIVVTDEPSVARYCVDNSEDRLVHISESDLGKQQVHVISCGREEATASIKGISDHRLQRKRQMLYSDLHWSKSRYPVVSVWGIAGVGKSAAVRLFYTKAMLEPEEDQMFRDFLWVDVPHPFSLAELSRHLLLQIHSEDPQAKEVTLVSHIEGQDLVQYCRKWLQTFAQWLLVFDDMLSTDEWDSVNAAFGLSEPTYGSKIIVIASEESVAMHCVGGHKERVASVQGLDADAALHLFSEKIHNSDVDWEHSESIVAKCGGLPKVINAVAESYNNSLEFWHLNWKYINDNTMHILDGIHSLRGLFSWMQSYMETLKDELKPCIFYLPVFPIGHNIRWRRLLRRWIAEGYSRDTSSHTAEDNGKRMFFELVDLSIIQKQPSLRTCQVNGFFREYITSRPMEDNLVFALEGNCSLNSQRVGQHLTVRSNWDRDNNVFESTDFSRLRSLTVFGECRPFMFDSAKIKMRHVRVLDLEDASGLTNVDLEHIVELLPRLKFLSLRGHKEITHLPESLGDLIQLQTLDVRHTSIAMLPHAIVKLRNLQYVRAGTSEPWDEGCSMVICTPAEDAPTGSAVPGTPAQDATTVPAAARIRPRALLPSWLSKLCCQVPTGAGIVNLTSLHTFGVINLGAGGANIKELKRLTQLCRLGVSGINPDNIREFFSAISDLSHLESLLVQMNRNKHGFLASLDSTLSSPPKTLKKLSMHGHVRILPGSWVKDFARISKLDLEVTIQEQQDMDVVLDYLKDGRRSWLVNRLCIKPIHDGELHITGSDGGEISILEIVCTSNLQASIGNMYLVNVLRVQCSSGSSLQLAGLHRITLLKEVWLKGSDSNALKQDLQQQLTQHQDKPVLKVLQSRSS